MRIQTVKHRFWLLFAVCLGMGSADMGWAASCLSPPLSIEFITEFKANPSEALIPSAEADTRTVEVTTRDLAGTDSSLAPILIQVAQGARPRHQAAIAAGLAQAALACQGVDQQAALQIQQAVASFENVQFQALFAAVVGDLSTAATDAAASAATSSVGSVVVINPNRSSSNSSNPNRGGASSKGTNGVFAIVGGSTPGTTIAVGKTASDPVSPTR